MRVSPPWTDKSRNFILRKEKEEGEEEQRWDATTECDGSSSSLDRPSIAPVGAEQEQLVRADSDHVPILLLELSSCHARVSCKGVISDASKVSLERSGISSGASTDADGKRRGEPSKRKLVLLCEENAWNAAPVGSSDAGGKNGGQWK